MLKTLTLYVATIIFDKQIVSYDTSSHLLTDNRPLVLAKQFKKLCPDLKPKLFGRPTYHPQTNSQFERYNQAPVAILHCCILYNEEDWDKYLQQ